jgi:hypothetical protein
MASRSGAEGLRITLAMPGRRPSATTEISRVGGLVKLSTCLGREPVTGSQVELPGLLDIDLELFAERLQAFFGRGERHHLFGRRDPDVLHSGDLFGCPALDGIQWSGHGLPLDF